MATEPGVVIHFPVKRLCFDCENALIGPGGVFCGVYQEHIWNEKVAEECEEYEPPHYGPVTIINGGS